MFLYSMKESKLTFESAVKLKNWNKIPKTKKIIPTIIPNDSSLQTQTNITLTIKDKLGV